MLVTYRLKLGFHKRKFIFQPSPLIGHDSFREGRMYLYDTDTVGIYWNLRNCSDRNGILILHHQPFVPHHFYLDTSPHHPKLGPKERQEKKPNCDTCSPLLPRVYKTHQDETPKLSPQDNAAWKTKKKTVPPRNLT